MNYIKVCTLHDWMHYMSSRFSGLQAPISSKVTLDFCDVKMYGQRKKQAKKEEQIDNGMDDGTRNERKYEGRNDETKKATSQIMMHPLEGKKLKIAIAGMR